MIEKINKKKYEEVIKEGNVIVDFSATWCGPCQMLAPVLEELSDEYAENVKFYNVDTDENIELATSLNIEGVPTVNFYKNGEIVNTSVGFLPKANMKKWIDSNI